MSETTLRLTNISKEHLSRFQTALDGMAKEEVNARWQESMEPFFENLAGSHADESMLELEEVFHLD